MTTRTVKHIKTRIPAHGTRPIRSDFFQGTTRRGILVKVNRGRWAANSVPNAVMHMQLNTYDARLCEVWDEDTGQLFAQIKRDVKGDLHITYLIPVEKWK